MALGGWLGAGVLLGLCFMGFAARRGPAGERRMLVVGLVVAALIYVVLALGTWEGWRVGLELGGLALFVSATWIAVRRGSASLLAAAWAGHAVWDGALHLGGPVTGVEWYAALCVTFDAVVAWRILARATRVGRTGMGRMRMMHG